MKSNLDADVAKLADALDLGSSAVRHAGSTPVIRTDKKDVIFTSFFIFYPPLSINRHRRRLPYFYK